MKEKSSSTRRSKCATFFTRLLFDNDGKNELCHICLTIVSDPIRHARQVHLRQPVFQCPCCSFYSTWNEVAVNIHLVVAHGDPPHCEPIDNSPLYAASLQDCVNKCYGWTELPAEFVMLNSLPIISGDSMVDGCFIAQLNKNETLSTYFIASTCRSLISEICRVQGG